MLMEPAGYHAVVCPSTMGGNADNTTM